MVDKKNLSGIFNIMSANQTMERAKSIKQPRQLWGDFWMENEVCCLFADSNVGKSILAVQIADHVARNMENGESVLYYDFELSAKQFEMRYTHPKTKEPFKFADNFIRVELNSDTIKEYCAKYKMSLDDLIISGVEENINAYNAKVIIIDNISWLANMKMNGANAGKLMMRLCELKRKYNVSLLVLAHTPKRNLGSPITQNNLTGSKTLVNFFDAMFTVGQCRHNPSMRYIKQIKVRSGAFQYGEDHVDLCYISKNGAFLGFRHIGYSTEKEQLTDKDKATLPPKAKKRKARDKSELAKSQINKIEQMVFRKFRKLTSVN